MLPHENKLRPGQVGRPTPFDISRIPIVHSVHEGGIGRWGRMRRGVKKGWQREGHRTVDVTF